MAELEAGYKSVTSRCTRFELVGRSPRVLQSEYNRERRLSDSFIRPCRRLLKPVASIYSWGCPPPRPPLSLGGQEPPRRGLGGRQPPVVRVRGGFEGPPTSFELAGVPAEGHFGMAFSQEVLPGSGGAYWWDWQAAAKQGGRMALKTRRQH
jgi:hypothetical protein